MSYANGFSMPGAQYKGATKHKRDDSEDDSNDPRKKTKHFTESSDEDSDHDSRPATDNDYPEALTDLAAFHAFYKEIVLDVWQTTTNHQFTKEEWLWFVREVRELAKKNHFSLSEDDGEKTMIHVCCTMYANKENINTKPRWEMIKSMKSLYENNILPRTPFKNAEGVEKRRTKIVIEDNNDPEEEFVPEKNALTFLQTYELNALPLACILQKKAQDAGVHGGVSRTNNELLVYEESSLNPFLLPALIEFVKDLVNPREEISDNEPVRWGRHIFDEDDVLNDRIKQHRNVRDLKLKLQIKNCEPGDESWFKQVKLEIAKKCGMRFVTDFPNKVKRDELNRPLYTRNDIANMKVVYKNVMGDLKL